MNKPIIPSVGSKSDDQSAWTLCAFEPEEYRADLEGLALTEAQAEEILEILWSIMGHFARLGYSVDVCGLIFPEFNEASAAARENGTLLPSTNMESASKPDGGSA